MYYLVISRDRFKEALWVNVKFYLIVGGVGGVAGVIFLQLSQLYKLQCFYAYILETSIVSFLLSLDWPIPMVCALVYFC